MSLRVTIHPGAVVVESVSVLSAFPGCVVLLVDTATKYPELAGVGGSSDGRRTVYLAASDRALHVDEGRRGVDTAIHIDGVVPAAGDEQWLCSVDASGRYDAIVTLVRVGGDDDVLWWRGGGEAAG